MISNVNDRKHVEEELHQSEDSFQGFFENTAIGLYRTTPQGQILLANLAFLGMLGYASFEELAQRNLDEHDFESDFSRSHFRTFLVSQGEVKGLEATWRKKDGSTIFVRENARVVRDPAGQVLYYEGSVEDITARKQAELELEHERGLMKALMDASPESIYFKDSQLRFILVSRSTALREGFQQPEDMIGKTDFDFFDRESAQAFYDQEMKIMHSGQPVVNREVKGQRPGQAPRWVSYTEAPLRDAAGQVIGVFAISRDITDRKQAEQELERERDLMKAMMDTSPDSIYFKDAQLRFLRVSRTTAQKEGFAQPELMIGKTDFDLFDHETAQNYYDQEMEIMASGQPVENRVEKGHLPDGTPRWYLDSEVPLRDAAGQVTGVFAISRDITELKQTELELERERDLMRALMDNIPDAIFFKDTQLRFFRANKAAALKEGLQQPELMIGKTDFDFFARESAQEYYELEMEIMRTGRPVVDLEQQEQRPGQPPTWGSTTEMPLYDAAGQVIGVFGITRDITGRKKIEQALVASEERLSLAMEAANDGLWDWNIVTGQVLSQPALLQHAGLCPG